jgi:hypothetical protein
LTRETEGGMEKTFTILFFEKGYSRGNEAIREGIYEFIDK